MDNGSEFERLVYESALRSLDNQDALLTELRARTGVLLAASALAASFLGRSAERTSHAWLIVAALVAFVVTMSTSVFVLLPKKNLVFAVSAPALYEGLYAHRADLREVYRRLAYDLHRFWEGNDATIRRLVGAYRIGAVALVVEVAILVVAATGKLL